MKADANRPSEALLIQIDCRAEHGGEGWIAFCDALGVSDQGRTLEEARAHVRMALDLFLNDCMERGVLEDVLKTRKVSFTRVPLADPATFGPADGIQQLTALRGEPHRAVDSAIERLRVMVPAVQPGRIHARAGAD